MRLINENIRLSKIMTTLSIGRTSAIMYSYITAIPTMSGYITNDLVSSHVKICEPILKRKVKPDPDIKVGFKNVMMTALQMYPPAGNDTATNAIMSLVKDRASSMEINDEIHVSLKIPNWDVKTGIVTNVSANIPLTSKKKPIAIIRTMEMIESTGWMEDTLVGSGSRKVRGAAKVSTICPESFSTVAVQHMILGKINQMMLSESASG